MKIPSSLSHNHAEMSHAQDCPILLHLCTLSSMVDIDVAYLTAGFRAAQVVLWQRLLLL